MKKLVPIYLKYIQKLLNLTDWDIEVKYKVDDNYCGSVDYCSFTYKEAIIILNLNEHKKKEDLFDTILHECIHIFTSIYEVYRELVEKEIKTNISLERLYDVLDEMMNQKIRYIIYNNFKLTKRKLIIQAEKEVNNE